MKAKIKAEPQGTWHDETGSVRVMATVEGWVVARRKGAMPFLTHANDFFKRFLPGPTDTNSRAAAEGEG